MSNARHLRVRPGAAARASASASALAGPCGRDARPVPRAQAHGRRHGLRPWRRRMRRPWAGAGDGRSRAGETSRGASISLSANFRGVEGVPAHDARAKPPSIPACWPRRADVAGREVWKASRERRQRMPCTTSAATIRVDRVDSPPAARVPGSRPLPPWFVDGQTPHGVCRCSTSTIRSAAASRDAGCMPSRAPTPAACRAGRSAAASARGCRPRRGCGARGRSGGGAGRRR